MTQQNERVYYLLSQEGENVYSDHALKMSKYRFIDPDHMNNFFEVIKVNFNAYKIVKIYKNEGLSGKFNVDDIIYFDEGMISFCTKNHDNKIDQCECFPTALIEKEKVTLFSEEIEETIDKLINLILNNKDKNDDKCINNKYDDIFDALQFFHND